MSTTTLAGLLLEGDGPDDEVLVHFQDACTSREELKASARQLRDALRRAGLPWRAPVGVMLPNGAPLVAAVFGVLAADAAYVPLNPRMSDGELAAVIEHVRPAAIVTDQPERVPDGVAQVEPAPDQGWTATDRPERLPDGTARPEPAADHSWTAVGTIDPATPTLGEDVAFVQFTSGTTGRPKPVPLRADTVLALMDGVVAKLRGATARAERARVGKADEAQPAAGQTTPDPAGGHQCDGPAARGSADRRPAMPNLIPVSLSLWAGIYNVLFAFRVGAPVVLMAQFETGEFARLVRAFGIRSVVLPPAAMTMLADDEAVPDLTPLRLVRSVSAPLSPLQARRFKQRFGATVLNGYGQTELGGEVIGWSAADARAHGDDKLGAIGRPHAGIELRIVGVPDERLGEVPWAFVVTSQPVTADELRRHCRHHLAPYKLPAGVVHLPELPRNEIGKVVSGRLVELATTEGGPEPPSPRGTP